MHINQRGCVGTCETEINEWIKRIKCTRWPSARSKVPTAGKRQSGRGKRLACSRFGLYRHSARARVGTLPLCYHIPTPTSVGRYYHKRKRRHRYRSAWRHPFVPTMHHLSLGWRVFRSDPEEALARSGDQGARVVRRCTYWLGHGLASAAIRPTGLTKWIPHGPVRPAGGFKAMRQPRNILVPAR